MTTFLLRPTLPISERREWNTALVRTRTSESRQALRALPRVTVELTQSIRDTERFQLEQRLEAFRAAVGGAHLVPDWRDRQVLPATGATVTTVAVDTASVRWSTSAAFFLADDETQDTERSGVTTGSGSISWSGSLALPTTGTSWVMPLRSARLRAVSVRGPAYGLHDLVTTWEYEDGLDDATASDSTRLATTYRDRPVLPLRPVGAQHAVSLDRDVRVFGAVGARSWFSYDASARTMALSGRDTVASERAETLRMLRDLRGRQGSFWLPTWRQDFGAVSGITGGFRSARTTELNDRWLAADTAWDVLVTSSAGVMTAARITGRSLGVSTIDWATSPSVSSAAEVSRLYLCRLDADRVELRHDVDGTRWSVPVVQVPEGEIA